MIYKRPVTLFTSGEFTCGLGTESRERYLIFNNVSLVFQTMLVCSFLKLKYMYVCMYIIICVICPDESVEGVPKKSPEWP